MFQSLGKFIRMLPAVTPCISIHC